VRFLDSDAEADQARWKRRTAPPDWAGSTKTRTEAWASPAASTKTAPAPAGPVAAAPVDELCVLDDIRPRLWCRRGARRTRESNR
jgi:hypothetical protein